MNRYYQHIGVCSSEVRGRRKAFQTEYEKTCGRNVLTPCRKDEPL